MNFYHFKTGNTSPLSQLSLSLIIKICSINFFFLLQIFFLRDNDGQEDQRQETTIESV
jgi:hypothetical protein